MSDRPAPVPPDLTPPGPGNLVGAPPTTGWQQPYSPPVPAHPYAASSGGRPPQPPQPPQPYGQPYRPPTASRTNGVAIASLVIGLFAVPMSAVPFLCFLGVALALLAAGLGVSGIRRAPLVGGKGMAVGGTVAGVVALVLGIVITVYTIRFTEELVDDWFDNRSQEEVTDEPEDRSDPADQGQASPAESSPLAGVRGPQGSTASGGIPVAVAGIAGTDAGAAPDAVVVTVYLDYMCPYCRQFEEINAPTLAALRVDGEIVVDYHPVSILDRLSQSSGYSTRTATAVAHVADLAPEAFLAFHTALFAGQPQEGTTGLTDAEIATLARGAGVPEAVAATIESGEYLTGPGSFVPWVAAATEQGAQDLGRLATPAVLIDGVPLQYNWSEPGALEQAIVEARG